MHNIHNAPSKIYSTKVLTILSLIRISFLQAFFQTKRSLVALFVVFFAASYK